MYAGPLNIAHFQDTYMQQGQVSEAPNLYYNVNTPPPDEMAPPIPLPEESTNDEATKLTQSTKRNYYRKKKEGKGLSSTVEPWLKTTLI